MTSKGLKDQKRRQWTRDRRLRPWDHNFKICMNLTAKAGQQLNIHSPEITERVMFHQQKEITWGVPLIGQFKRGRQGVAAATS